ncbi:MAG: hypothetical protein V5B78_04115 [Desulfohalobiaceae bacterium]
MEHREKKIAAISAGLAYYLQEEQEAAQLMQQAQQPPPQPRPAFPENSPWAMSGRQAIMERRYQWQFRLVR